MAKKLQENEFCFDDIAVDKLLGSSSTDTSRAWVVTSAQPSDGATTVLLGLARSLTLRGKSVLVVDANLRDPELHCRLDVPQSPGLIDVLYADCALDEAIRKTSGVHVLPLGCGELDSLKLIAAMETLLTEMKQRFDFVLIDTLSVEVSLNAARLGTFADGVVLVVCAGKTVERAARNARKCLTEGKINLIGVILNRYRDYFPGFLRRHCQSS